MAHIICYMLGFRFFESSMLEYQGILNDVLPVPYYDAISISLSLITFFSKSLTVIQHNSDILVPAIENRHVV